MEYNNLITRVQKASVDAPDTDAILGGMRRTLHRRHRQRQVAISLAIVLAVGTAVATMQPRHDRAVTLAELVSLRIDTPPSPEPAPIAGYRNSLYNHQIIYTLL